MTLQKNMLGMMQGTGTRYEHILWCTLIKFSKIKKYKKIIKIFGGCSCRGKQIQRRRPFKAANL